MIGDERDNLRVNAWIRGGKKNGLFVRPRLFMPYYEEIKVISIKQKKKWQILKLWKSKKIDDYKFEFSLSWTFQISGCMIYGAQRGSANLICFIRNYNSTKKQNWKLK